MMNAGTTTLDAMNDADENYNNTTNDNNNSSGDNLIRDDINNNRKQRKAWGTWEELLLASAVKRHGFRDWDSVAMEVQSRSSLPRLLTTAQNCKQKYRDLKRRFEEDGKAETDDAEDEDDNIPWLEQLRSLRVAELRRELHRYDVSILSLQLKVKKLEEERDRKLDLDGDSKGDRSENDGTEPARPNSAKAEEESERENMSINESNSTASGGKPGADGQEREESANLDPDPDCKAAKEETWSRGSEVSHSGELGESGTSEGFGRTWKRKGRKNRSGEEGLVGGEMRSVEGKSEPLISFLEMIRAHSCGSLFERRFRTQETEEYKSLVRQHLDLETIQKKLEQGYYSASTLSFYRDLHLLFTNALVFFPKSSSESTAAHQLRSLVSIKLNQQSPKSTSLPLQSDHPLHVKPDPDTSDLSLTQLKYPAPLVVCRTRSSVSTKPCFSQRGENKPDEISGEKDKIVASVRSSKRTNKGVSSAAKNIKKQAAPETDSSKDTKQEPPKTGKKTRSSSKKKSVADFLKRIKNSPANSPKKGGGSTGKEQNKSGGSGKKDTKAKQKEQRSNNADKRKPEEHNSTPLKKVTGRQQRKAASSSGKQGRKTSGSCGGKDSKRPKKRTRR
ncbi:PREDICTED: uncharacterized protein LOC104827578 isoform X2 [Tarenaya hassleriana]|uniref:uncharacterized protein LOC104827578 isoform X2 n=1 Tax=Tarenaya hassleriana TaxID=28532 RepID=UPI0008FD4153|nr:PREDICTED: uncharacterized protein LOC104827578 isoform X2 [Tarenaya hassleriana]